jgi:transposase
MIEGARGSMHVIGVDVSKAKLHCLLLFGPEYEKTRQKAVTNDPQGFASLLEWACRQAQCEPQELHIVMEATGIYHERAAFAFYEAGATVSVVNPAQLKNFAKGLAVRSKSDSQDRAVLARYGALVKPAPWQPPPLEVRHLRALLARLEALEIELRRERNRQAQAQLTEAPEAVQSSLHKSVSFFEDEKRRLEREIDDHIQRHPELRRDKDLLESIPAVGPKTAWRLLALLRGRAFRHASQAAAYLGLVPIQHQSGTTVYKRPRLSKAGDPSLRAALYMAAVVAIQHNPDIRDLYERLLDRGKAKMAALGAAMRKLVHIAFGVLKNQQEYRPQGA